MIHLLKRFVLICGVIVLGCVVSLAWFKVTFDPDIYRSEIEQFLDEEFGLNSKLGYLTYDMGGSDVKIRIGGVIIRNKLQELLFKAPQMEVRIDLFSFITRKFAIKSIKILEPYIRLNRLENKGWNWPFWAIFDPEKGLFQLKQDNVWIVGENVIALQIKQGTLIYQDYAEKPHVQFFLNHVNLHTLKIEGNDVFFKSYGQSKAQNTVHDFYLKGVYQVDNQNMRFNFDWDDEKIKVNGNLLFAKLAPPSFDGLIKVRNFDMTGIQGRSITENFLPAGFITAQMEGSFQEIHPSLMFRSSAVEGALIIKDGYLKSLDFIKNGLQDLSQNSVFSSRSPHAKRMSFPIPNEDTRYNAFKAGFEINRGVVKWKEMSLLHPDYLMWANGDYSLKNHLLELHGKLIFMESWTEDIKTQLPSLQKALKENERLTLPFRYTGVYPNDLEIEFETQTLVKAAEEHDLRESAMDQETQATAKLSELMGKKL